MPIHVAQSDGFAEYERNRRTPAENAAFTTQKLDRLWEEIKATERELAIYLRMPKFDKAEYDRLMEEYLKGKPL